MHDLLSRVPRTVTRYRNGELEDATLDEIKPDDRQGDVVPVDQIGFPSLPQSLHAGGVTFAPTTPAALKLLW